VPAGRFFGAAAAWTFGSGARAATTGYVVLAVALGVFAFLWGGSGPDDLYPGAVFIAVTAPLSVPAFELLPTKWVDSRAFLYALIFLAPAGTAALVLLLRAALRRLASLLRRAS
jgi:hypothetical protein